MAIETRKDFDEEADWKISQEPPRKHHSSEPFTASGIASRHASKDESKEGSSNLPHSTLKSDFSRQELLQLDSLENLKPQREVLIRDPPQPQPSEDSFRYRKLTKKTMLSTSEDRHADPNRHHSIPVSHPRPAPEPAFGPASRPKDPAGQSPA